MPPVPSAVLRVEALAKRYGATEAVRGASLAVAPGEIYGLLGPNGAGKTTFLECVLGLRFPDAGTVAVAGVDPGAGPAAARRRVGAQLQAAALPDRITGREALQLFGAFHPGAQPDVLVAEFGLTDFVDAAFATLSGGQRQRVLLALACVGDPALLILDEPTAGLDPASRRALHDLLRARRAAGTAVLLSTHDLGEAARLCDRVGILHRGRLVAEGSPETLVAGARAAAHVEFHTEPPLADIVVAGLPGTAARSLAPGRWRLEARHPAETVAAIATAASAAGARLVSLRVDAPTLEQAFLELTGDAWDGGEAAS